MVGLAASKENVDRFRFFESAGNVSMLGMELHVLLAEVMPRFGGSTCVLAGSHAEKEGEDNAAPNGVVSSSGWTDSFVVAAKHGWRSRLGPFVGDPGSGHAFDISLVLEGESDLDVSGGLMIPRNSADLGQDGSSSVGMFFPFVEVCGVA